MKRLIIILGLILIPLLVSCKKDPETEDFKNYVQSQLFPIRTNLRAATTQYEKSTSKNELARSGIIRTKVLYQYRKYLDGLKAIKTKTGYTEHLNEEGIEKVTAVIDALEVYRKAMLKRDAHLTMRSRMDVETSMDKVKKWQEEIWENAKARQISVPADIN